MIGPVGQDMLDDRRIIRKQAAVAGGCPPRSCLQADDNHLSHPPSGEPE